VHYIHHFVHAILAAEHDESVSLLLFSDTRDVVFSSNPFDALLDLRINRADPAVGEAGAESDPAIKGVVIGAEEVSFFCNGPARRQGNTPDWHRRLLGDAASARLLESEDRLLPDGSAIPILCSGAYFASMEASRLYHDDFVTNMRCNDGGQWSQWGIDQAGATTPLLVGISATRALYDAYILSPLVGMMRHFHYYDVDHFQIHVDYSGKPKPDSGAVAGPGSSFPAPKTHQYVNCAGRHFALLHQLDRKEFRYAAWADAMNSAFREVEVIPLPAAARPKPQPIF
jgi:hypothetical protein